MSCLYETVKDLKGRIGGTICRYQDDPVYCTVTNKGTIQLQDIRAVFDSQFGAILKEISPKDPDFDISSIELGYLNWEVSPAMRYPHSSMKRGGNQVSFLSRPPAKRYCQGLQADYIRRQSIDGVDEGDANYVLHSEGFIKLCRNDYPPLPEAIERLTKGGESGIAISREFALKSLDSTLILAFCEMKNIGWILPRSMKIEVPEGELQWIYRQMMDRLVGEY